MQFFANQTVNRVYLHAAIQAIAETGGGVFFLVLLLKAGFSPPLALCTMAAILAGRFVLRAGVLPLARRIGLRNTLILGTLLDSSSYWLTPHVTGPGAMLALLIAAGSLGSVLYWTSYHAYVAGAGDAEQRGAQVGFIEAVNALIAIVAPGVVSLLLITAGPIWGYAVVALVQMLAAVPLIGAPDVAIPPEADDGRALRRMGAAIYFNEGWSVGGAYFVWMIALFVTLGEDIGSYGGAMVAAGLAGAVISLATGRLIDLGHGKASVVVAFSFAALSVVAKALAFATPWAAVAAAAFGAIASSLRIPTVMTRIYNLSQQSGCPLRFHIAAEAGWDVGAASSCLIAAVLIHLGYGMGSAVLLALLGLGGAAGLLLKSYRA
jgi:MFS transporter, DHA1 family, inner membrane transport protein